MRNFLLLLLSTIIITVLIYSCNKEENIVPNDLAGTWKHNSGSITFKKNWEYIDSAYSLLSTDSLMIVIEGNYNIEDDLIHLSNLKYTYYSESPGTVTKEYFSNTLKYEIVNNSLSMTQISIFEPIEHNGNTINGIWETSRLIVVYDTRQNPSFLSGDQIMSIDFSESSEEYNVTYKDTYGTEQNTNSMGPYKYNVIDNEIFGEFGFSASWNDGKVITENGSVTYHR